MCEGEGEDRHRTGHKGPKDKFSSTRSLTSAIVGVGDKRHAPATLPLGKTHGTHCLGGWVGPRVDLDGRGNFRRHRDWISGPSSSGSCRGVHTLCETWCCQCGPRDCRGSIQSAVK